MSGHPKKPSGKSPYQRSNRTWRARGPMLLFTVIVLLIAAGAWVSVYTRSLETTKMQAGQQIDPAIAKTVNTQRATR